MERTTNAKEKTGICIGKKYVVKSDPLNLILYEKKVRKKGPNQGNEYLQDIGYFPNIQSLASELIELKIRAADVETLDELIETVNDAKKELIEGLKIFKYKKEGK